MRRKGHPSKSRRVSRRDDGSVEKKGYEWLKEWLERQEDVPGTLGDKEEQELRSMESHVLVRSFSRLFREGREKERDKMLGWTVPVLGDRADEFLSAVVASKDSRLVEKRIALDQLKKKHARIEPGLEDEVEGGWRFVTEDFPALINEHAEEGCLGEKGWERFRKLPDRVTGAVVRQLLEQYPAETMVFFDSVSGQNPDFLDTILDLLGETPHEEAARFLRSAHGKVRDKSLQKKIKRANHKRRVKGLPFFDLEAGRQERAIWSPPVPPKPLGLFSLSPSPEFRLVWVIRPNVRKGMLAFSGWLHDLRGLVQFFVLDFSSREAEKFRDSLFENKEMTVVEADPGYCAHLFEDAYLKGAPQDPKEAELYRGYRTLLKEIVPEETPLSPIHEVFHEREEDEASGDPLGESANLLKHGLLQAWQMDLGSLQPYVEKLTEITESKLIVHPLQKKERTEAFYRDVVRERLSDPAYREVWKRRVEDMAWVMYQTGEVGLAKRLFQIGNDLGDPGRDVSRIAFFNRMVQQTLEELLKQKKVDDKEKPSLIIKPS